MESIPPPRNEMCAARPCVWLLPPSHLVIVSVSYAAISIARGW